MELTLNGVTKKYHNSIAVNQVTLSFQNGIYGFLGANGAGKTTLFKMICGLIRPTEGTVLFNQQAVNEQSAQYYRILGYLPQETGYYPDFTAIQFLRYISEIKGMGSDVYEQRIQELLKLVSLSEVSHEKIKTFSGGMKRRLGIAQALLNEPKVLVLDEPTAGLDPKERVYFRGIISNLSKDAIILLSTHIASDIEYIANQIIILNRGNILADGSLEQLSEGSRSLVWTCSVPSKDVQALSDTFCVVNIKNDPNSENSELRIISDNPPTPSACQTAPTLEDIYLSYFQ